MYLAIVVVVRVSIGATQFLAGGDGVVAIRSNERVIARNETRPCVYGKRATPYEVLSGFSEHVSETYGGEDILPRMARLLAEGTGADRRHGVAARRRGDAPRRHVAGAGPAADSIASDADGLPTFPSGCRVAVGTGRAICWSAYGHDADERSDLPEEDKPPGRPGRTGEPRPRRASVPFEDLRSPRLPVASPHAERARLERNIDDGAQQQLVALAVKVRLAEGLVGQDEQRQREALHGILDHAQHRWRNCATSRADLPPLLPIWSPRGDEAQARKAPFPVTSTHDGVRAIPGATSRRRHFSVLEALQNVAKYAEASNVVASPP